MDTTGILPNYKGILCSEVASKKVQSHKPHPQLVVLSYITKTT